MGPDRSVVEVRLEDGTTIHMVALDYGGAQEVSAFDHLDFSEVTDAIKAVAPLGEGSIDTIKPDTASVEFGVQVAVKSGNLTGLLVGGSGEASSKVIWAGELRTADSPNAGQGTRTPRPGARLQKPGTPALLAGRADSIMATSAIC